MPRTAQDVRNNPVPGDIVYNHVVQRVDATGVQTNRRLWTLAGWCRTYAFEDALINFVVPYHVGEVVRLGGPDGVDVVFDGMYAIGGTDFADVRIGEARVRVWLDDLTPLPALAENRAT